MWFDQRLIRDMARNLLVDPAGNVVQLQLDLNARRSDRVWIARAVLTHHEFVRTMLESTEIFGEYADLRHAYLDLERYPDLYQEIMGFTPEFQEDGNV